MPKQFLKGVVTGTPLEKLARATYAALGRLSFKSSEDYWEKRYQKGGTSGSGSYGRLAEYKAEVLNDFVRTHDVSSVIEFGSGDGHQLLLSQYERYTGVDISPAAVAGCKAKFADDATKSFMTTADYDGQRADLALSLDVIYHLVEDAVFERYMVTLFDAAERFVIVYASNKNEQPAEMHVRHRKFTDWVTSHRQDFELLDHQPNRYPFDPADPDNTSFADFYFFRRIG